MARDHFDFDLTGTDRFMFAMMDITEMMDVEDSEVIEDALDDEVIPAIRDRLPFLTGELQRSVERRDRTVHVGAVYAPVLEFATKGRWSGLTERFGKTPPRFFFSHLEEDADRLIEAIANAVERRWD